MIIIDTNVVSALMRATPDIAVLHWLDRQPARSIWTTAITLLEIRFGIERLASGRRRDALADAFAQLIDQDLERRILSFGEAEAAQTAVLMARRETAGRTTNVADSMIAGIVRTHKAVLATRNVKHFDDADVVVVNPWELV